MKTVKGCKSSTQREDLAEYESDANPVGLRIRVCYHSGHPVGKALIKLRAVSRFYEAGQPRRARQAAVELNRLILELAK